MNKNKNSIERETKLKNNGLFQLLTDQNKTGNIATIFPWCTDVTVKSPVNSASAMVLLQLESPGAQQDAHITINERYLKSNAQEKYFSYCHYTIWTRYADNSELAQRWFFSEQGKFIDVLAKFYKCADSEGKVVAFPLALESSKLPYISNLVRDLIYFREQKIASLREQKVVMEYEIGNLSRQAKNNTAVEISNLQATFVNTVQLINRYSSDIYGFDRSVQLLVHFLGNYLKPKEVAEPKSLLLTPAYDLKKPSNAPANNIVKPLPVVKQETKVNSEPKEQISTKLSPKVFELNKQFEDLERKLIKDSMVNIDLLGKHFESVKKLQQETMLHTLFETSNTHDARALKYILDNIKLISAKDNFTQSILEYKNLGFIQETYVLIESELDFKFFDDMMDKICACDKSEQIKIYTLYD